MAGANGRFRASVDWVQTLRHSVSLWALCVCAVISPRLRGEIRLLAVTTSAGFKPGLPGPGSSATIFCTGLNVSSPITVIYADSKRAPILGVADLGAYQIVNFQVPWEEHVGPAVLAQDGFAATIPSDVAPWGEFFTTPDGYAVALHAADFSVVSEENPVRPREWIALYGSNFGPVKDPPPSGAPAPVDRPTPVDPGFPVGWASHV